MTTADQHENYYCFMSRAADELMARKAICRITDLMDAGSWIKAEVLFSCYRKELESLGLREVSESLRNIRSTLMTERSRVLIEGCSDIEVSEQMFAGREMMPNMIWARVDDSLRLSSSISHRRIRNAYCK